MGTCDTSKYRHGEVSQSKWPRYYRQLSGANQLDRSHLRNGIGTGKAPTPQVTWTNLLTWIYKSFTRCNGCSMFPIEGARYHCQVCADFDFCQACFEKGESHGHAFERTDDQGQQAVFVGSPKAKRKSRHCRVGSKHCPCYSTELVMENHTKYLTKSCFVLQS